jgi:integrase
MAKHYADFVLPEQNPFKEIGQLQESPHRYVSKIEIGKLLESADKELRRQHPGSYVAFVLSLYCGMRRGEIGGLTWEQVISATSTSGSARRNSSLQKQRIQRTESMLRRWYLRF